MTDSTDEPLKQTPLCSLHEELGAKMVPFAGYSMPVQYKDGVLKEHLHTRTAAGLFDVSHMGQAVLSGAGAAPFLETLVPGAIGALEPSRMRYSVLLNPQGGIIDDLMILRLDEDRFHLVVNAAKKDEDFQHIGAATGGGISLEPLPDRALIALQGPAAASVVGGLAPGAERLEFLQGAHTSINGADALITRSGYTGEDGYEISVDAAEAEALARCLLADERVRPIGLGARDSLRLEAGLCLYGHDIDEGTSPIEAGLAWIIPKSRRVAEAGYPGAERIARELAEGASRRRVGIKPAGRAIAREGTVVLSADGEQIGTVTSGGFGPSAEAPVAMGYIAPPHHAVGTDIQLEVRGKRHEAQVAKLPFVPHRYFKP